MRPRYYVPILLVLALLGGVLAVPAVRGEAASMISTGEHAAWVGSAVTRPRLAPSPTSPTPQSSPSNSLESLVPTTIKVPDTDFFGWALLDRRTGDITGSDNMSTGTNSTESMIKVWIVADYLRQLPAGSTPDDGTLDELAAAIIHSDDNAAEKYYQLGGGDAVVQRMIDMCGLTDTTIYPGWWSRTQMTPQDAVRLGECVADKTAAGKTWTPWVLQQMRSVQGGVDDQQDTTGGGYWGIVDGLPASLADGLAIKNGWTAIGDDGDWHVNNLAISNDWVLVVMVRYPIDEGLGYGADICSSVAHQLLPALQA
jgi:hypothetical protein